MNILFFILLSLLQSIDYSGNRILTDSIMKNPDILLEISQDTNFVTSEFKKYESINLINVYREHIKNNFLKKEYNLILDTLVKVYSEKHKDNFYFGSEVIYKNPQNNEYIQFGFSFIDNKWKICYILPNKPGNYP